MPKIIEQNLKSKHADSFRILKKHGYRLTNKDKESEYFTHNNGNTVVIHDDGRWKSDHRTSGAIAVGSSHTTLEAHLKKIHR